MLTFVDTGVWYAAHVPRDAQNSVCRDALAAASPHLITTDYILDELVTLLIGRGLRSTAVEIGDLLWAQTAATLHRVTDQDLDAAWSVLKGFSDKQWSFTDCTSYAVMQRHGITEALSLDDHFRQFGFVAVLP